MKLAINYMVGEFKNVVFTTHPIRFSTTHAIVILPFSEDVKNSNLPEILKIEFCNLLEIKFFQ